jgi:hypothetical protein
MEREMRRRELSAALARPPKIVAEHLATMRAGDKLLPHLHVAILPQDLPPSDYGLVVHLWTLVLCGSDRIEQERRGGTELTIRERLFDVGPRSQALGQTIA